MLITTPLIAWGLPVVDGRVGDWFVETEEHTNYYEEYSYLLVRLKTYIGGHNMSWSWPSKEYNAQAALNELCQWARTDLLSVANSLNVAMGKI